MTLEIRNVLPADWSSIEAIQVAAYTEIEPESPAVLRSKVEHSPETCFVAVSDAGQIAGYCLAHPWPAEGAPPLYTVSLSPVDATNLFVHDLAVSAAFRGRGVAHALWEALHRVCRGKSFETATLVSIQGTSPFWAKMEFAPVPGAAVSPAYGAGAVFMSREL